MTTASGPRDEHPSGSTRRPESEPGPARDGAHPAAAPSGPGQSPGAAGSRDVAESGSFRDRDGRVFYRDGDVLRGLSADGLADWEHLAASGFFGRAAEAGQIIGTERLPAAAAGADWAGVLRHDRVPFVSYPYEWPFGMLQDAAGLTLELLAAALEEDTILKDATPYNVQWFGTRPTFIDVLSFTPLLPGGAWTGYRQFCELFLYPLMLQAYKGVPFQPWLRGSIDGITPDQCRALMSARDLARPGVLLHVKLQAAMQTRHAHSPRDVRADLARAGFHRELIVANVRRLSKLVSRLRWKAERSTWSDYADCNTYDEANRAAKADFVRRATARRPRRLVWDLGCNTGEYARVAAETADYVVAMDADQLAIERLYRTLRDEGAGAAISAGRAPTRPRTDVAERILPLTVDLTDSSPDLGWRGSERKRLTARGTPDLALCLALVHHVVLGAHVPLADFVDWLAGLGCDLVIEFVSKADPMVTTLLRNKDDKDRDYEQPAFEAYLARHFEIEESLPLNGGLRTIYSARRRD